MGQKGTETSTKLAVSTNPAKNTKEQPGSKRNSAK